MTPNVRSLTKLQDHVLNASGTHGWSRMMQLIKTNLLLEKEIGVRQDGGYG